MSHAICFAMQSLRTADSIRQIREMIKVFKNTKTIQQQCHEEQESTCYTYEEIIAKLKPVKAQHDTQ